jgi:hypothetical protein
MVTERLRLKHPEIRLRRLRAAPQPGARSRREPEGFSEGVEAGEPSHPGAGP